MFFRAAGAPTYGVSGPLTKSSVGFAHGLNERASLDAIDSDLTHRESILQDSEKSSAQATAATPRRRRIAAPAPRKPRPIIAQVAGSGTPPANCTLPPKKP